MQTAVNPKLARVIASQLYVARNLQKKPAKTLQFIMKNREYFPHVTDDWIVKIKKELHITDDDIKREHSGTFAGLDAEIIQEREMMAKALSRRPKN